jgi:hypothetical protein
MQLQVTSAHAKWMAGMRKEKCGLALFSNLNSKVHTKSFCIFIES